MVQIVSYERDLCIALESAKSLLPSELEETWSRFTLHSLSTTVL